MLNNCSNLKSSAYFYRNSNYSDNEKLYFSQSQLNFKSLYKENILKINDKNYLFKIKNKQFLDIKNDISFILKTMRYNLKKKMFYIYKIYLKKINTKISYYIDF